MTKENERTIIFYRAQTENTEVKRYQKWKSNSVVKEENTCFNRSNNLLLSKKKTKTKNKTQRKQFELLEI